MLRFGRALLLPLFLLSAGIATAYSQPSQTHAALANTVVLIIRHAEKPEDGSGLTPAGEKRARAYVGYFKAYQLDAQPLKLSHLFAAADSTNSRRPRLTIEPLATALHMPPDIRFTDKDPESLAQDLEAHDHGREILICWRHGRIPALLTALGADPHQFVPEGKWPGTIYDRVIELHFDARGKLDSRDSRLVLEHLMPGDEK